MNHEGKDPYEIERIDQFKKWAAENWTDDIEIYHGLLTKSVVELFELFCKQGHSGASAEVTAHCFKLLVTHQMPFDWKDPVS